MRPDSEFLRSDDHTRPWWPGCGRKIHCRTVYLRRVTELLKAVLGDLITLSTEAILFTEKLTETLVVTHVFRPLGYVIALNKREWPWIPHFVGTGFLHDTTRERHGITLPEPDQAPKVMADAILREINNLPSRR